MTPSVGRLASRFAWPQRVGTVTRVCHPPNCYRVGAVWDLRNSHVLSRSQRISRCFIGNVGNVWRLRPYRSYFSRLGRQQSNQRCCTNRCVVRYGISLCLEPQARGPDLNRCSSARIRGRACCVRSDWSFPCLSSLNAIGSKLRAA